MMGILVGVFVDVLSHFMDVLGSADFYMMHWPHICKNGNTQFPSVDMGKLVVRHTSNSYMELGNHLEWMLLPWLQVTDFRHQQTCTNSLGDSAEYLQWMEHEATCSTVGRPLEYAAWYRQMQEEITLVQTEDVLYDKWWSEAHQNSQHHMTLCIWEGTQNQ